MGRIGNAIARFLNAVPLAEMEGLRLRGPSWQVDSKGLDPAAFFRELSDLVSEQATLVLEGGAHPTSLKLFLKTHSVPPREHVARGTMWPRAAVVHVPCFSAVLSELGDVAENCASAEICDHLHVYKNGAVLLKGYDAFLLPFVVSKQLPRHKLQDFCRTLGMDFRGGDEGPA